MSPSKAAARHPLRVTGAGRPRWVDHTQEEPWGAPSTLPSDGRVPSNSLSSSQSGNQGSCGAEGKKG